MGKYSENNLIVGITYYKNRAASVKKCCDEYEKLLDTYIGYLIEINEYGIMSGKTADILAATISEISSIKGDITEVGNDYAATIEEFLSAIDKADKKMFVNKGRKVFTDDEFKKARAATDVKFSLSSFIDGTWLLKNICRIDIIEEIVRNSSRLMRIVKEQSEYTKKELDKIQKNLKSVDSAYKLALNNVYEELRNYIKIVLTIAEIMSPDGNNFNKKNLSKLRKQIKDFKKFKNQVNVDPFYIKVTQKEPGDIPGLEQGFVPQGITYDKDNDWLIISGYYGGENEGYPSQIMIIDRKSGKLVKAISLRKKDGSLYTGHAGGVAYIDGKLYITSDGHVYTIPGEELKNAGNNDVIKFSQEELIEPKSKGSYANASNGVLYIGDFDKKDNDKDYSYCLAQDTRTGEKYYIRTPRQAQGITVTEDGKYIVSTSYGRNSDSEIYYYSGRSKKPIGKHNGVDVYDLEFEKKTKAPPMSEGVCTVDGKTYIIHESGAKEYSFLAIRKPINHFYTID